MYFAIGYGIGELIHHGIEKFRDHLARTSTYDPVYSVVQDNREEIYQGGVVAVKTAQQYPGEFAAAGVFLASRVSPFIGAVMLYYDLYRWANMSNNNILVIGDNFMRIS